MRRTGSGSLGGKVTTGKKRDVGKTVAARRGEESRSERRRTMAIRGEGALNETNLSITRRGCTGFTSEQVGNNETARKMTGLI